MKYTLGFLASLIFMVSSCNQMSQEEKREIITTDHEVKPSKLHNDSIGTTKKIYIPVYSDIYQRTRNDRTPLTSTLSIHNTSETDTLYISRIDYYNTKGEFVRKYIESPIFLKTFETIEYVVDEEDNSGGSGANFVIEWYGSKTLNPIFQAVMIGGLGSKSFSFTTTGVEIQ